MPRNFTIKIKETAAVLTTLVIAWQFALSGNEFNIIKNELSFMYMDLYDRYIALKIHVTAEIVLETNSSGF